MHNTMYQVINLFFQFPNEIVTWYANKTDLARPTAQDMTKLMTPRSHWSNVPGKLNRDNNIQN